MAGLNDALSFSTVDSAVYKATNESAFLSLKRWYYKWETCMFIPDYVKGFSTLKELTSSYVTCKKDSYKHLINNDL